jgi:hypothetical protein
MTDSIYQMNVTYSPEEDRLLLRITTQKGVEFRVWLTRRYCTLLMGVLEKEIGKRGGMPVVASTPETRQMFREGAMDKPFDDKGARQHPLGEDGILAYGISTLEKPGDVLGLELQPQNGQGVTINLNQSLLFMFHNLLTQGIDRANWRLPERESANENIH